MLSGTGEGERSAVSPLHKKPEKREGIDLITQSENSRYILAADHNRNTSLVGIWNKGIYAKERSTFRDGLFSGGWVTRFSSLVREVSVRTGETEER